MREVMRAAVSALTAAGLDKMAETSRAAHATETEMNAVLSWWDSWAFPQ